MPNRFYANFFNILCHLWLWNLESMTSTDTFESTNAMLYVFWLNSKRYNLWSLHIIYLKSLTKYILLGKIALFLLPNQTIARLIIVVSYLVQTVLLASKHINSYFPSSDPRQSVLGLLLQTPNAYSPTHIITSFEAHSFEVLRRLSSFTFYCCSDRHFFLQPKQTF